MILVIGLLIALPAWAERRVALVVGNGNYQAVESLDNPVSDARLIAATLEEVGFEVMLVLDTDLGTLNREISRFGRRLRQAGRDATGLFYYAGHGVQSFGTNYLLPVDTELSDAADLDLVAVTANSVLRQMYSAQNRTNIVILDACRNNPFDDLPEFGENGLAEMKAPTGTFLAYATAPGAVAYDGTGPNSPFTAALSTEMQIPGQPIEQMFRRVRVQVLERTGGAQTPWDTSSLTAEFQFRQQVLPTAAELAEERMWEEIQKSRDPLQIMLFLRGYPDSRFETAARQLLAEVVSQELPGDTPPPSGGATPSDTDVPAEPAVPSVLATSPVPDPRERALIETARASDELADYQAYLDAYPDGVYAELAKLKVAEHYRLAAAEPASPGPPSNAAGGVVFDQPLVLGGENIAGRSIAELIKGSPLFPPVAGLPDSYWKGQTCGNCHQWTREALCTQANVYLAENAERALGKSHPYGGGFKQVLKSWASADCP